MPDRLQLDDPHLFPVQAFFNAIPDRDFVEMSHALLEQVGYHFNEVHCEFDGEAVTFSIFEDEITLTNVQLVDFLRQATKAYGRTDPRRAKVIFDLIGTD